MMVFDLICANKHTFEAWFKDSKSFEQLRRKGEVECPACGDGQVEKALMAPAVATSKKRTEAAKANAAMAVEAMQVLGKMRQHVEENCDYVGTEFAEEARKIHYGETEKRDIYGEATKAEADNLSEEGVDFTAIPWVPRADS
ncbi:MAG: DUF1178 family protein [Alphaproteobacteria bacterium]|jgi:hypothetical protein|nr:DUF1178 family protein [Alphaproteobacteria bacterium]MDP6565540.1 DUF1178 family protein [Alphaproteobacteria bacterium]MDP6812079.1 DUF1178 family protein [Alphaproteobacteria bacterium]